MQPLSARGRCCWARLIRTSTCFLGGWMNALGPDIPPAVLGTLAMPMREEVWGGGMREWGEVGYMGWGDERAKGDLTYHKHTSAWVVCICMITMYHKHTRHSPIAWHMSPTTHKTHAHACPCTSSVNMFTDSKNICKYGYACNCITHIATSHLTKSWYSKTRETTYTVYEYMTWAFSGFGCSKIFQLMPTYRPGLLMVGKIDTTGFSLEAECTGLWFQHSAKIRLIRKLHFVHI